MENADNLLKESNDSKIEYKSDDMAINQINYTPRSVRDNLVDALSKCAQSVKILQTEVSELSKALTSSHNQIILGELIRQLEKRVCFNVMGKKGFTSISQMIKHLNNNPKKEINITRIKKWKKINETLRWDNDDVKRLVKQLKNKRLYFAHPTTTYERDNITKNFLNNLVAEKIPDKNDLVNIITMINMLSDMVKDDKCLFTLDK